MLEGREVTWFPSYGAEMRGGTANCTVIISDDMIGSPVVSVPDVLITMNRVSLDRFLPKLKKKGVLIYDSSLIKKPSLRKDIEAVGVPATSIAGSVGNTKSANMVIIGALIACTGILGKSSVVRIFAMGEGSVKRPQDKLNTNAVLEGIQYIENTKG